MVITGLTRNQLYLTVPWVRIPPSPPRRFVPRKRAARETLRLFSIKAGDGERVCLLHDKNVEGGVIVRGSESRLIEYMEGAKKRFVIPVYQRNYNWKTENCKQLLTIC